MPIIEHNVVNHRFASLKSHLFADLIEGPPIFYISQINRSYPNIVNNCTLVQLDKSNYQPFDERRKDLFYYEVTKYGKKDFLNFVLYPNEDILSWLCDNITSQVYFDRRGHTGFEHINSLEVVRTPIYFPNVSDAVLVKTMWG